MDGRTRGENLSIGRNIAKGHKEGCGDTLSPMSLRDATHRKRRVYLIPGRRMIMKKNIIYQMVDVAVSVKHKLKWMYQMGRK